MNGACPICNATMSSDACPACGLISMQETGFLWSERPAPAPRPFPTEANARIEELEAALQGLVDAHREVFPKSIFAGFQAGKSTFHKAWCVATDALSRMGEPSKKGE